MMHGTHGGAWFFGHPHIYLNILTSINKHMNQYTNIGNLLKYMRNRLKQIKSYEYIWKTYSDL